MKLIVAVTLVVVSLSAAEIPRHRVEIVRPPKPAVAQVKTPPSVAAAAATDAPEADSTTERLSENLESFDEEEAKPVPAEKNEAGTPQFYFVLPEKQNLVYSLPQRAAFVAAPLPRVSSGVFTPWSSSFVQIYQQ